MTGPSFTGQGATYDFVTYQGQAAQAVMPQVGYAGATLTATFDQNRLDHSTITAGTATVSSSFLTLQLSAAEVDAIKSARFTITAGTTVVAQGKVTWTPDPVKTTEQQIDADLAAVALTGKYSDLIGNPDLSIYTPNDPALSNFTYDATTGNLLSYTENGVLITLTYNSDGTVATSQRGVSPVRSYSYTNGNLEGVS